MFIDTSFLNQGNFHSNNTISHYLHSINNALEKGLDSISPDKVVVNNIFVKNDNLIINKNTISIRNKNLYIIGAGKATYNIAKSLIPLLGIRYKTGIINIPKVQGNEQITLPNTFIHLTGHPIPDEDTFNASLEQIKLLESLTEDDIVFVIITGGASALFEVPETDLNKNDVIETYKQLLVSGLPIQKINIIRKHLSQVKGGKLINKTKAQIIGLLISDIPGDDIGSIGSGPTVPVYSSVQKCLTILKESGLYQTLPKNVVNYLSIKEQSFKTYPSQENIQKLSPLNFLLSSNSTILKTIQEYFLSFDLSTDICTTAFSGDSQEIANFLSRYILFPYVGIPKCLIFGGESTVQIGENINLTDSQGGRNQELVLSFMLNYLNNRFFSNVILVSIGTDGIDGHSSNAGAIFISEIHKNKITEIEHLQQQLKVHNSAQCLPLECYIKTGPTGSNVGDVIILLIY